MAAPDDWEPRSTLLARPVRFFLAGTVVIIFTGLVYWFDLVDFWASPFPETNHAAVAWVLQCIGVPAVLRDEAIWLRAGFFKPAVPSDAWLLTLFAGGCFGWAAFADRPLRQKLALAASVIPILWLANLGRLVLAGVIFEFGGATIDPRTVLADSGGGWTLAFALVLLGLESMLWLELERFGRWLLSEPREPSVASLGEADQEEGFASTWFRPAPTMPEPELTAEQLQAMALDEDAPSWWGRWLRREPAMPKPEVTAEELQAMDSGEAPASWWRRWFQREAKMPEPDMTAEQRRALDEELPAWWRRWFRAEPAMPVVDVETAEEGFFEDEKMGFFRRLFRRRSLPKVRRKHHRTEP